MKIMKRLCSAAAALAVLITAPAVMPAKNADAATKVTISPYDVYDINGGVFEGWGTSLCWWANRIGYSDSLSQKAADAFFGEDGLRLNIARFNIGGGDDPTHTHITRTDSNMPGYTRYNNGTVTYDWTADANQRNVLDRCIKAAGEDMIVEMFSNSPPYYMTNSGCSSGAVKASENNLRDDKYTDFAEYLAEVCYHFEHDWGVDIQSVTPMNEPYTDYWGAGSNKQEGCHFDQGRSMDTIYQELYKSLQKRGLDDIMLSACDESVIDTQITSYNKLSADTKSIIDRIDTHTYGGSKRSELRQTAISAGKNLWMSEVDGGSTAGSNAGEMGAALWLADRITLDCNELNPSAWILWQVIDNHISANGYNGRKDSGMVNTSGGYWGVAVADHDKDNIILTKKYYSFGQFSRYIRPGMTMLKASGNCVSAYDSKNKQLVIVATNDSGAKDMSFDLSQFDTVGSYAQTIRTSNSESWKDAGNAALTGSILNVSLPANSVTTYIISDVTGGGALTDKIDVTSGMLSGSDSWNSDPATSFRMAFDGSISTYFDGVGSGWIQADLGDVYDISAIGFSPRSGYEYRMTDGRFMTSLDGQTWDTVYTVSGKPSFGMHYVTKLTGNTMARYFRYEVPEGKPNNEFNKDSVYCANIAEIELYGKPAAAASYERIEPVSVSGSGSWKDSPDVTCEKAFDGDLSTYFDGLEGGWIQADLGAVCDIKAIGYCPRKGYEARMCDGRIMVSMDGKSWTTVYTVTKVPGAKLNFVPDIDGIKARYVRYEIPTGAPQNPYNTDSVYNCNIAELAIYGSRLPGGDINGDGASDRSDLVMLQKYLLGAQKLTDFASADVNGDGSVDVFDMIALRRLLIA